MATSHIAPHIAVEGLKEFQADLRAQTGKLPDELGQIHKDIGNFIISKIPPGDPHAVGTGAMAQVRSSATKREVLIQTGSNSRVDRYIEDVKKGQKLRSVNAEQWGKDLQPFISGRPYIVGAVDANEKAIEQKFMDGYTKVLGAAFYSAE